MSIFFVYFHLSSKLKAKSSQQENFGFTLKFTHSQSHTNAHGQTQNKIKWRWRWRWRRGRCKIPNQRKIKCHQLTTSNYQVIKNAQYKINTKNNPSKSKSKSTETAKNSSHQKVASQRRIWWGKNLKIQIEMKRKRKKQKGKVELFILRFLSVSSLIVKSFHNCWLFCNLWCA